MFVWCIYFKLFKVLEISWINQSDDIFGWMYGKQSQQKCNFVHVLPLYICKSRTVELFIFNVHVYVHVYTSEQSICMFVWFKISFIHLLLFFFIVARNIHYQMSSFNENSAFGLIKHSCVELLAYPCMTYCVYSLDVLAEL